MALNLSHTLFSTAPILLTSCLQVLAAPPATPGNPATKPAGQSYRTRVEAISRDLLWANSLMLRSLEKYEDARSSLEKPKKNTDPATAKAESEAAKASLIAHMKTVRQNAARLKSLSPVPRPWKKLDDSLIESSWEWSSAMENLDLWLQHPSSALKTESAKHGRRAQALLDATRRKLWALSDQSVASKTYAD